MKRRIPAVLLFALLLLILSSLALSAQAGDCNAALDYTATFLEDGRIEICERWYIENNVTQGITASGTYGIYKNENNEVTPIIKFSTYPAYTASYDDQGYIPVLFDNIQVTVNGKPYSLGYNYNFNHVPTIYGGYFWQHTLSIDLNHCNDTRQLNICVQYTLDRYKTSFSEKVMENEENGKCFVFYPNQCSVKHQNDMFSHLNCIEDFEFHVILPEGYSLSNPSKWEPEGNQSYVYTEGNALTKLCPFSYSRSFYQPIQVDICKDNNEKVTWGKREDNKHYAFYTNSYDTSYYINYDINDHASKFADKTLNRTELKNMNVLATVQQDGSVLVEEDWEYMVTGQSVNPVTLEMPLLSYAKTQFQSLLLDGEAVNEDHITVNKQEISAYGTLEPGVHHYTLNYTIPNAVQLTQENQAVMDCDFFRKDLYCICPVNLLVVFPENSQAKLLYQSNTLTSVPVEDQSALMLWAAESMRMQHSVLTSLEGTDQEPKDDYYSYDVQFSTRTEMGRVVLSFAPDAFSGLAAASEDYSVSSLSESAKGIEKTSYYNGRNIDEQSRYNEYKESEQKAQSEMTGIIVSGILEISIPLILIIFCIYKTIKKKREEKIRKQVKEEILSKKENSNQPFEK